MRRIIAIGAIVALSAWVIAQVGGADLLGNYAKSLNGAKSLSATYTVQRIGGTTNTYSVELAKPNKARIDTPTQLIVADGANITTYDKTDKSYFKKPMSEAELKEIFSADELSMFGPFFDAKFLANKAVSVKAAGQKNRRGVTYNVVAMTMDKEGKKVVSFYLDPKDNLSKLGEYVLNDSGVSDTLLVMTRDFVLDGAQKPDMFAFTPPSGAREITEEELAAGTWYKNFAEAQAMAKKLNRPMFVDFYADW